MSRLVELQSSGDARRMARRRLPWMVFDFIDGATGEERASAGNRRALERLQLQPRVLVDVAQRDLSCELLGRKLDLPFGIAPMGMCNLSWPDADRAFGALAARHGIPHCLSTAASTSLEDGRQVAGDNAWFQLYVSDPESAWGLVDRAMEAGYAHLILTVDTPLISRRRRELRRGFQVPFRMGPSQLLDFMVHPRWSLTTLTHGVPRFGNNRAVAGDTQRAFNRAQSRDGVDWAFLDALRARWPHKLVVKGVLAAEDAMRICAAGADAVYVSNHGGRQLDSAPPAIDVLPRIRQALGPDFPIIFDSGLRDGEDIVKAYALGADFVMLGRPFLYAAGAAGAAGVARLVEVLTQEVHAAMAQIGCTRIQALDANALVRPLPSAPTTALQQVGETQPEGSEEHPWQRSRHMS